MTKEEFGQKIKSIRLSMDMSQIKFANLLGWKDSQSIAQIESGKVTFPPDKVISLCRIAPEIKVEEIIDHLVSLQREKIKEKVFSVYKKDK